MAYGYDAIGQLKSAIGLEAGGTTNRWQEQFGYGYDAAHNLNYRTNAALVQAFNVNNLNELTVISNRGTVTVAGTTTIPATSVTVNGVAANHYADATFAGTNQGWVAGNNTYTAVAWDVAGNMASNRVTVNLPGTNNYTYDLNGNLLSDGARGFDYDDENELIRVTVTNRFKKEYNYDGRHRLRIRKEYAWGGSAWAETNEIRYIYDGKVILQERDTNNVVTLTFTRGLDLSGTRQGAGGIGGVLAMTEGTGTNSYYHSDAGGNVMVLINTNQQVVARYEYDPFGAPLAVSGPKALVNPIWYSSQVYDPATGFSHYLYRVYVPEWQRWLNRDPIQEWGGVNLYEYIKNNSVDNIDLLGLALLPPNFIGPLQPTDTRIPYPPSNIPGGPWTWTPSGDPNAPKGTFYGPKQPSGPRTACKFVPAGSANDNTHPYWKVTNAGVPGTKRYSDAGNPISPEEAHPGSNAAAIEAAADAEAEAQAAAAAQARTAALEEDEIRTFFTALKYWEE